MSLEGFVRDSSGDCELCSCLIMEADGVSMKFVNWLNGMGDSASL